MKASGWDVVPWCVEAGARRYIDDKWGTMSKLSENKPFKDRVSTVAQWRSYYIYLS